MCDFMKMFSIHMLQESVGVREPNYLYTVHDVKLLLLKFAKELSFNEDTQGGGRQSNLHLLPYLMQTALHVMLWYVLCVHLVKKCQLQCA